MAYLQGATWVEDIVRVAQLPSAEVPPGWGGVRLPDPHRQRGRRRHGVPAGHAAGTPTGPDRPLQRDRDPAWDGSWSARWPRQKESEHLSALQEAVEQRTADLIAARNRAVAQSDARSTLFSTVSHDLQTPLHAALSEAPGRDDGRGPARAAGSGSDPPDRARAADQGACRARRARGRTSDHPRVVDLGRVLEDVVAAHIATMRQRDAASDVVVVASASNEVLVDVDRFRRILHTLLAGRLMEQSPGAVRIRLEVRATWADLTVEEPSPGQRAPPWPSPGSVGRGGRRRDDSHRPA